MYSFIPIALSALIGWIAWPCHLLPLAIIAPTIIMRSPSRATATLSALAYYLNASSGIPHGAAVFFGPASTMEGFALWLAASVVNALPWAVLWHRDSFLRFRAALALIILSIPPLGLVGWASPLTAAGMFFPGFGFAGLALTLWLIVRTLNSVFYSDPIVVTIDVGAMMITALLFASLANLVYTEPSTCSMTAIDTHFGGVASGSRDYFAEYQRNLSAIDLASKSKARITVLPETVAGTWTSATTELWKTVATHSSGIIAIGAERLLPRNGYENGMVLMNKSGYSFFPQRVPVPVSMWKPWSKDGARADWFGSGVAQFDRHKIGYLICYEQLLVWPALITGYNKPDMVLGLANGWWAKDTSIPGIQRMSIKSWARLFGWQMVDAINL